MSTSAVAGAAKPLAAPNVIASHSTTGSASYPLVPAGLMMCVKGVPRLGARTPLAFKFMGALIWIPERRGTSARSKMRARFRSKLCSRSPRPGPAYCPMKTPSFV